VAKRGVWSFAVSPATCQSDTMSDAQSPNLPESNLSGPDLPGRPPERGGGCLIAAGLIIGPTLGLMVGQTSAGLVIGGIIGVVAAIALVFADSRRR
jgi:hypothetical protein